MKINNVLASVKRKIQSHIGRHGDTSTTNRSKYFFSTHQRNDEYNKQIFSNYHSDQSKHLVNITHTKSSHFVNFENNMAKSSFTAENNNDTALVDSLLTYTSSLVEISGTNIIAYSGGIDSSLAALLVKQVFPHDNNLKGGSDGGEVKAVIGVSSSLPQRQLDLARSIARHIDIDLIEVPTTEGTDETYIANDGKSCYICKNHLYSALEAVASKASQLSSKSQDTEIKTILFNGTNADDTKDPTRLGLLSAKSFSVKSPLINITKDEVRRAAKHLNLPNWNYAASPCLRSRLALGVEATDNHLKAVSQAEERVRQLLSIDETVNLRVRMLAGKRAMIELDQHLIEMPTKNDRNDNQLSIEAMLREEGFEEFCRNLGFTGGLGVRAFKTGSVSLKRH